MYRLVDSPHALKKLCRLQLRLKTPADTVLRQVTRMGSLSGATGPGFSSSVARGGGGLKGPQGTPGESTMGAGGAGEPNFLKCESECVLDFRYCYSLQFPPGSLRDALGASGRCYSPTRGIRVLF